MTSLVFLDESAAQTTLSRLYGRAPRGQRLVEAVPAGPWRTRTLVAAVRCDGVLAPLLLDGSMNGATFAGYVRRVLVPELRPGDVVVWDNLAAHKVVGAREAIEAAGARVLLLPPYSPDFNPIEHVWAKVKAWLRKAAARTWAALLDAVADALRAVTESDCQGCFAHGGYHPATQKEKVL